MAREILHLHVPSFHVALARLCDPSLRGRPAVVSGAGPRPVVICASAEARREGIAKGMLLAQARRLCRSLGVAAHDPVRAAAAEGELRETAVRYTPLWEPVRPGHLYLDMTGSRRLFGPPRDAAAKLAGEVVKSMVLSAAVGVGMNKLVSSVASKVLSGNGVLDVMPGSEAAFLSPLSVKLLPGLGEKRLSVLRDWNVRSIGEFASLPVTRLVRVFGPLGAVLHQRALGMDTTPVNAPGGEERICENRVLDSDEEDDGMLLAHINALVESGSMKLRAARRAAARLELRIVYSDGVEARNGASLKNPAFWDFDFKPVIRELFFKTCLRRVRVRRLELVFSRMGSMPAQLPLFPDGPERNRLLLLGRALDEIRKTHGFDSVGFAASPSFLRKG